MQCLTFIPLEGKCINGKRAALMSHFSRLVYTQSASYHRSHSPVHTHTFVGGGSCHSGCQPAHRKHFGVKYLAQGHIDSWTGGPISGRPFLPSGVLSSSSPHWYVKEAKTSLKIEIMPRDSLLIFAGQRLCLQTSLLKFCPPRDKC